MGLDNGMGEARKTEKWRKQLRMYPNPSFLPGQLEDREHR